MQGLGTGVTLETGHVTPGAGSGDGGHPGDCGRVTPGAGSGDGGHPGDWTCEPRSRIRVLCGPHPI